MRTINIAFVGYWNDYNYKTQHIFNLLVKHYNVNVCDKPEDADYIICSVFDKKYQYCKYDKIRIMYVGENYIPDFNFIDYGICNYPIKFQDRNFYFPFCIDEFGHCENLETKYRNYPNTILKDKIYFANFIAGHESEFGIRGEFFKKLCEYKRVESPGSYLNNMPNGEIVQWDNDSKRSFQSKSKFTLCFESTKHEGFITEKITDAFYADTIPVYYGSENIKEIFNEKAFINCSDYSSFDAVIEKIKELDQNDDNYMEMLRQPIFVDEHFPSKKLHELENYLIHIFEQPIEQAGRRSKVYSPRGHECYLNAINSNKTLENQMKIIDNLNILKKKIFKR